MKPKRITSIRSSLARLVAACLLPAVVMAAVLLYYDYQRGRAELVRQSLSTVRTLMQAVDQEFAGAEMSLRTLATSPSLDKQDFSAFHAQANEVLRRHSINNIVLIDTTGQQRMNTVRPHGEPLPGANNAAQLQRVLASGQPDISNLFIGPVSNKPLINVAVPVTSGDKVTHSLVGVLLPERLQKILTEHRFQPDRIGVIFDASGNIVARTREIERLIGLPLSPDLFKRQNEVDEDAFEAMLRGGIPGLSVFTRSATTRWGVAIAIPIEALTRDLWRSLWLLIGFATLLLAGSLALAWRMGGRIAASIQALRTPALGLGDVTAGVVAVPPLPIREVDEVGRAIARASETLAGAAAALTGSEARMRGILESAMDAIITVDDNQTIVLFNSAAAAMFGCPVELAIGLSITSFIPDRFHARHHAYVRQHSGLGDSSEAFGVAGIAVGLRRNGEEFPLEVSYSNVVESGATFHTLIIRDVTVRVRAYEALARSNLDLQQFAYVASHDLKTPLRSIAGFVQLLEKNYASKLDEKALTLIRRTAAAAARLEQLTDNLLSYARVNSEARPFALVDFEEVLDDVLQLLDAALSSSSAIVTAGPLPTVMGDRTQLVQLLLNLIGNSIKYCDRAPEVHVAAERQDKSWVFSVTDNGIGMDEKHHERVFEIFKRLHTQQEYSGTGIGLAICRRVVSGHGGTIWIKSAPGQGCTFSFSLPDTPAEGTSHA